MSDIFASETPAGERNVTMTDSAVSRIARLMEQEDGDSLFLRITVSGGGCSGFQYGFSLDDRQNDDDLVFEHNGIKVVIDEVSMDFVKGSQLDYVEDLIGSFFSLKNPNAASTCGCGTSFAV